MNRLSRYRWLVRAIVALPVLFSVVWVIAAPRPGSAQSQDKVGDWSAMQTWPIVSVHAHVLPTGNVLIWPYSDSPRFWDPVTTIITNAAPAGRNIFCSGHSFLADGKLFVPSGHIANDVGLPSASYYDPFTNSWGSLPDMNAGRWYPSSTTLANGDVLVTSGTIDVGVTNTTPQVYEAATESWRTLTSAVLGLPLYPRTFLAPNGRVFFATSTSRYLDTEGSGAWTTVATRLNPGRDNHGSACMYEPGKVLFAGGADPPTASCEIIDLNEATPRWTATGSMPQPRRQLNVTILPDGKVLATGGSSGPGHDNPNFPVYAAALWDPATGEWTTMASCTRYRGYHSTAILLPDGRVLSSGGDNQPSAEVYSPPYLFMGPRPTIASAPDSVSLGETFFVETPDAASIREVTWTAPGSATHAQDWNQRINFLSFTKAPDGLYVTAPSSGSLCPPGYYMLWILNSSGVPSVSAMIKVTLGPSQKIRS